MSKDKFDISPEEIEKMSKKCEQFWDVIKKTQFVTPDEKYKAFRELHIAPTPKAEIYRENSMRLYYCVPDKDTESIGSPLLIVPSLINRNYIMDLQPGNSLIEALVKVGIPVYLIDWGTPGPEHGDLTFDDMIEGMISRCVKRMKRHSGSDTYNLLGQCIGGIFTTIYAALHQDEGMLSLTNLTAPVDMDKGGKLKEWTDPKIFNLEKITESFRQDGVVPAHILHAGFPFLDLSLTFNKYKNLFNFSDNEAFVSLYRALDFWGNDNVPFAVNVFERFIRDIYQKNSLIKGELLIKDKRVDLDNIKVPVYNVLAEFDHVFPAEAARGWRKKRKGDKEDVYQGGHVTIVAGLPVRFEVYQNIAEFIATK